MRRLILVILALSSLATAQPWAGVLTTARATDWTQAGVVGGIPSAAWSNCVTAACNTLFGGTVTVASINAALNSAPNSTVVRIPAGSFTINSPVFTNRGLVVLRGAGPTSTTITLGSGADIFFSGSGSGGLGGFPGNLGSTNWTAGLTQGSTVLTVASTTGIVANQRLVLDQHNAAYVFTNGVENGIGGRCFPGNSCGRNDSPLQWDQNDTRAQQEMVEVQSVDSPTQLTIKAPGIGHTYTIGLVPQVFFWNNGGNIQNAGVENMKVNANGQANAISMPWCDSCWVKNVWMTNIGRAGVYFEWGMHDEFRDSAISASNTPGGPTEYGAEILETSFAKIENIVYFGVTAPVLAEGTYGTVVGSVYSKNTATGSQFAALDTHLSHNWKMLWEGSVLDSNPSFDNSWGSASHNTLLRNYALGHSTNKSNYRYPIKVTAHNWYQNLVGNVFGDPTYHIAYVCNQANPLGSDNFIYNLGFWNDCLNGIDGTNPYDTVSESSLMRWGNWDAVTYCANGGHAGTACGSTGSNGVRFCTGAGAGNPACTASETASGDANFPGLASPSTTIASSFYLTSKPAWFGSVTWPPIGPDVTCTVNCNANTASHAAKIPAQLCYENSAKDPNGFLTTFDAATCYPGTGAPVGVFAPSSLSFGNQNVGTPSPTQNMSFSNSGAATMNIASIIVTGANASDFSQSNTCSSTLAVSASCTITVTFTPTGVGAKIASVTVTSDASNSPTVAGLTGTGIVAFSQINGVSIGGSVSIH